MGIYVNPGNLAFQEALNSMIYLDKSELISYTNRILSTQQKYICVSRPRRFGKSMAANMLTAYYSNGCNSKSLFFDLNISKDESFLIHLNQHYVIRLDIQQFLFNELHLDIFIDKIQEAVIKELKIECGDCFEVDQYGLPGVLRQIYAHIKRGFIFIIDEWDCVFRIAKEHKKIQKEYLDFLRGLFKGADYIELVYMTGILPIKKYGEHSAINIFKEYSMLSPGKIAQYFGFTDTEVQNLCKQYHINYNKTKIWYDGYLLNTFHIYNPQAVIELMDNGEFQNYWTGTETYEALKIYIDMNFDGLKETIIKMLGNGHCKINTRTFQNDMTTLKTKDDVLTLLIHLGYLTYDKRKEEVLIPNKEIEQEFMNVMEGSGWDELIQSLNHSEELLQKTWALDEKMVAQGMTKIHNETSSLLKYNNETSLTCTILIAYYSAKVYYMNPIMELPSGKNFADVVYLPKQGMEYPALIIELKWNKSAEGAIKQIKNKQYSSWIQEYTGNILLVGINYNTKNKMHECIIEKYIIK